MSKNATKISRSIVLLVVVLSVTISTLVSIRIEVLNSRAGYILPRVDQGKWRGVAIEALWKFERGIPLEKPLQIEEVERMNSDPEVLRYRAQNELMGVLKKWWLVQLICIILSLSASAVGILGTRARWRLFFMFGFAVAVFNAYRMWALSYFGSLGF